MMRSIALRLVCPALLCAGFVSIVRHAATHDATVAGQPPAAAAVVGVSYPQSSGVVLAMGPTQLRAHGWSILEHFTSAGRSDTPDWETWNGKCDIGLQGATAVCPAPAKPQATQAIKTRKAVAAINAPSAAGTPTPSDPVRETRKNVALALEHPVQLKKLNTTPRAHKKSSGPNPDQHGPNPSTTNVQRESSISLTTTFYNCEATAFVYGMSDPTPCASGTWPNVPVAHPVSKADLRLRPYWRSLIQKNLGPATPGDISTTAPKTVIVKEMWQPLDGCGNNAPLRCGLLHIWLRGASHPDTPTTDGSVGLPLDWNGTVIPIDIGDMTCQPSTTLQVMAKSQISHTTKSVPLGCFRSVLRYPNLPGVAASYVVLTGFHIMTAETQNWTWSTFWLTPQPDAEGYGGDRPATLQATPWKFFSMNTTVTADLGLTHAPVTAGNPAGLTASNVIFNPYLEGSMPSGLTTNCLYCHRRAVFRNVGNPADPSTGRPLTCSLVRPLPAGCPQKAFVDADAKRDPLAYLKRPMLPTDPDGINFPASTSYPKGYYDHAVQTHFIWSLANHFN